MSLYNINKISIRKLELWSCCMEILQGQMLTVQVGRSYFEISNQRAILFIWVLHCKGVR